MTEPLNHHAALIYVMVTMSAVDRVMTDAELARIGGRVSSRAELTEAEQRIATLVAEGKTNREVAAGLFLTERSVETALTRIYRKLGVRSRSELAHQRAAKI